MSAATLILAINLLLGIALIGTFFGLYLYDRSARQNLCYGIGFIWAIGSGLLELALPDLESSLVARYAIFVTFLICMALLSEGLARQYNVSVNRRLVGAVFASGLLLNVVTLFMARNSLARMVLYQLPYVCLSLVCISTVVRARGERFGDRALLGLLILFTLHFVSRPFAALASGGMGRTASDYLSTFYAVTTQFDVAVLTIAITVTLIGLAVADIVAGLEHRIGQDALTGILNRSGFDAAVRHRLARPAPAGIRCCVIACDLDEFKAINDTLGHAAGDAVIKAFATILAGSLRKQDFCGRIGGEEFSVFLDTLDLASARMFAEAARTVFAATEIAALPEGRHVTASFGVTVITCADDVDAAYKRADRALYTAKRNGRNRVECEWSGLHEAMPRRTFTAG